MEKVLVTKQYLDSVKDCLLNKAHPLTLRSTKTSTNQYIDKMAKVSLRDLKSMITELDDTTEREVMLLCVQKLLIKKGAKK